MTSSCPRLYMPLKSALQTLYGLPKTVPDRFKNHKEANDFLMRFQNLNLRRRRNPKDSGTAKKIPDDQLGSTWIACVTLLCSENTVHAERLFAAQTLLTRLRSGYLIGAVDIEMENGYFDPNKSLEEVIVQPYKEWMSKCNHLIFLLISNRGQDDDEKRTKGEIAALTLSGVSFQVSASGYASQNHDLTPFLETIGNALATVALRIRYDVTSLSQNPPQPATPISVITIVTSSLITAASTFTTIHGQSNQHALDQALIISVGGVPDLLSPGGVRGFLSVDPKVLNMLSSELRNWDTGIRLFFNNLHPYFNQVGFHYNILTTLEKWVRVLPIPMGYFDSILLILKPHLHDNLKRSAFAFVTALFDSAQVETDQIVVAKAGMLEAAAKENKKKATRKKRRWQEKAKKVENSELIPEAQEESHLRKEVACHVCSQILDDMKGIILLEEYDDDEGAMVWTCASACVGSCLPHLVNTRELNSSQTELFLNNLELLLEICTSCQRGELVLGYEPLISLYEAVLKVEQRGADEPILKMAVENIYQCVMALVNSCVYPEGYFDDLAEDSDEELENIRGDIREVIRTIASPDKEFKAGGVSIRILEKIVIACSNAIGSGSGVTPPESAVHILSALAKPLFILAKDILKIGDQSIQILTLAVQSIGSICQNIMATHQLHDIKYSLPIIRLVLLATSTYSPLFNSILSYKSLPSSTLQNMELTIKVTSLSLHTTLKSIMQVATLALQIPELPAPSVGTIYDIRGAMRGPGADHHLACLALKRLTSEGDTLMDIILGRYETMYLFNLYQQIKNAGFDGKGTTPKSRRILIGVISRLGIYGMRKNDKALEPDEISATLQKLLYDPLEEIAACNNLEGSSAEMYRVTEACFDLASCSPEMVGMIFNAEADIFRGVRRLVEFGQLGYHHFDKPRGWNPDLCHQWGRLRAALLALFRASCNPILPYIALDAVECLNKAECTSFMNLLSTNAPSSAIFRMSVIGDEMLPAGAFVRVLGEVLEKVSSRMIDPSEKYEKCRGCITTLNNSKESVLNALLIQNYIEKDDMFLDPRPTLADAWYNALIALVKLCEENREMLKDQTIIDMICESCSALVLLILTQNLYDRQLQVIMSMDGPHAITMVDFLQKALTFGSDLLSQVGSHLRHKLQLYISDGDAGQIPSHIMGGIIIESAIFRAMSGGLPPWALENTSELQQAIFVACGNDGETFFHVMNMAVQVKLDDTSGFEGLHNGRNLPGQWIESWSEKSKAAFFENVKKVCYSNNVEGWKKIKALIRNSSGGTKNTNAFGMKPGKTSWSCDYA